MATAKRAAAKPAGPVVVELRDTDRHTFRGVANLVAELGGTVVEIDEKLVVEPGDEGREPLVEALRADPLVKEVA